MFKYAFKIPVLAAAGINLWCTWHYSSSVQCVLVVDCLIDHNILLSVSNRWTSLSLLLLLPIRLYFKNRSFCINFFHKVFRFLLAHRFSTHWFRLNLQVPEGWLNEEVHLVWDSLTEAMVWKNGEPVQVKLHQYLWETLEGVHSGFQVRSWASVMLSIIHSAHENALSWCLSFCFMFL